MPPKSGNITIKQMLVLSLFIGIFMPFVLFPLMFTVALVFVEAEEKAFPWWQIILNLIPLSYMYFSIITNIMKIQAANYYGKLPKMTIWKIFKLNAKGTLSLLGLQILTIIFNQFSPYSLLQAVFLQIFYFLQHFFELIMTRIIVTLPINENYYQNVITKTYPRESFKYKF